MHGGLEPMLSIVTGQPKLFSLDWLRDGGVKVGVVLALAVLISRIGTLTVRRVRRRLEGSPSATVAMDLHRVATLTTTLANAIRVIVWTIVLLTVLGQLGINLAPLLAGAGIAG